MALVVAVFLLAGWVKGVVGMGLPTVAMGALGLVMAPVQAAALLVVHATRRAHRHWNEPDGHVWEALTVSYARQAR